MIEKNEIHRLNTLLKRSKDLIPNDHLLLYGLLVEPDEDMTVFIHSFILVGPEYNCRRIVTKQLDLSFSDFSPLNESQIADPVFYWLSLNLTTGSILRNRYVEKLEHVWQPNWHTRNLCMPEGASYIELFN